MSVTGFGCVCTLQFSARGVRRPVVHLHTSRLIDEKPAVICETLEFLKHLSSLSLESPLTSSQTLRKPPNRDPHFLNRTFLIDKPDCMFLRSGGSRDNRASIARAQGDGHGCLGWSWLPVRGPPFPRTPRRGASTRRLPVTGELSGPSRESLYLSEDPRGGCTVSVLDHCFAMVYF